MKYGKPTTRWALWVFAAALLLKSAMPWLATTSAQMQGKDLVEVCTVYGVSLVPLQGRHDGAAPLHDTQAGLHGGSQSPTGDHVSSHAGDHCTLTALAALAADQPPALATIAPNLGASDSPRAQPSPQAPDACATWVARLKHGPPSFA